MSEPTSSSAGIAWLIKTYGLKLLAGSLGAALMFAVLWPRNAREGVARIACAVLGSALWGDAALAYVQQALPWWPEGSQGAMPVYAASGAPAWWLLGMAARWLDNRRTRDAGEVLADLRSPRAPD